MNKDAYYFPHFSNARYDRKIRRLRKQLGIEGYGIYFMLLEVLRDQDEFSYPLEDVDLLADEFGTSTEKILVVINTDSLFIITDSKFFYSPKLVEYLNPYLEQKNRNKINGIKGNLIKYGHATREELKNKSDSEILALNGSKVSLSGGESGGDRKESKVKEIKEKESKGENNATLQVADSLANHLLDSIIYNDPSHKYSKNKPAIKNWITEIDRAIRLDGRTEEQVRFIIDYVFRHNGKHSSFWIPNIQSGKKLREHFDTIKNQIKKEKTNGRTNQNSEQKYKEASDFYDRYYSESE